VRKREIDLLLADNFRLEQEKACLRVQLRDAKVEIGQIGGQCENLKIELEHVNEVEETTARNQS
jgi:hypothetical protein